MFNSQAAGHDPANVWAQMMQPQFGLTVEPTPTPTATPTSTPPKPDRLCSSSDSPFFSSSVFAHLPFD